MKPPFEMKFKQVNTIICLPVFVATISKWQTTDMPMTSVLEDIDTKSGLKITHGTQSNSLQGAKFKAWQINNALNIRETATKPHNV